MSRSRKHFRPLGMLTNNAGLPEVNPYTERARTDSVHRMHRQRLGQVKAKVDNSPPRRFPHIAANLKKQQMKNESDAQIRHDNELLLRKLESISQPRPHSVDLHYSTIPGIRLDKHMRPKLDTEKTRSLVSLSPIRGRVRHEEAIRISRENLRIGQRLQTQQGMYSSAEFRRIANTQETYLDNCRKFRPSGYYSRSSTPSLEGGRYRGASPFPSTGAASMPTLSPRALDRQSRGEPNV